MIEYVKMQKSEDILSIMSNLQPNCCLKIDFQNMDQHAGRKWLIPDTKPRKDNQLQSLKLPCRLSMLVVNIEYVSSVSPKSYTQFYGAILWLCHEYNLDRGCHTQGKVSQILVFLRVREKSEKCC